MTDRDSRDADLPPERAAGEAPAEKSREIEDSEDDAPIPSYPPPSTELEQLAPEPEAETSPFGHPLDTVSEIARPSLAVQTNAATPEPADPVAEPENAPPTPDESLNPLDADVQHRPPIDDTMDAPSVAKAEFAVAETASLTDDAQQSGFEPTTIEQEAAPALESRCETARDENFVHAPDVAPEAATALEPDSNEWLVSRLQSALTANEPAETPPANAVPEDVARDVAAPARAMPAEPFEEPPTTPVFTQERRAEVDALVQSITMPELSPQPVAPRPEPATRFTPQEVPSAPSAPTSAPFAFAPALDRARETEFHRATSDAPAAKPAPQPADTDTRVRVMRYLRLGARYGAYALAGYFALVAVLILLYRFVNPPASTLTAYQQLTGTEIVQVWVPIERMSPNLLRAVVIAEDWRFCEHSGIDLSALQDAIDNATDGIARGGSTISMQVIKNLFLWNAKSYVRKALEVPITLAAEIVWPKRRMLELYLNIAEWGPGVFGAEAASQFHFNKPASKLNEREAAQLAAALPNPVARDAGYPDGRTSRKAAVIQSRMRGAGSVAGCATDGR